MDIGKILRNGWELFIRDIGPLIIGALIAMILSVLSFFILAGPLFGGLYLMVVRRVREGRPAEFGDVFACFDRFSTLFLAWWGAGLLILLGLVLLVVPGLLLMTMWVYLLPLIVDKDLGVGEAMSRSRDMVMKGGFFIHFAALLVVGILTAVAVSITGGVGNLLTVPFSIAFVVAMYFVSLGEGGRVDVACGTVAAAPAAGIPTPPAVPEYAAAPPSGTVVPPAQASLQPVVDDHGRLEAHCTQCGATMDASSEFCSVCAAEVSGGHEAGFTPPSISKATGASDAEGAGGADD